MKPPTVFLGEMTSPEVEAFLAAGHDTVIVPTGSTEQHGPHGPLLTDVLVPQEVARRIAPTVGALVAPPINYALSYPHVGFTGVVHLRIPTFMALVEDLCASLAAIGFRRIVFLNGHYDNTYAIAYACASAADADAGRRPRLPGQLLGRHERDRGGRVLRPIDRAPRQPRRDVGGARDRPRARGHGRAPTPRCRRSPRSPTPRRSTPRSSSRLRARSIAPRTVGTWGDAREATAEYGERYLEVVAAATIRVLDDIERTFEAMPPR